MHNHENTTSGAVSQTVTSPPDHSKMKHDQHADHSDHSEHSNHMDHSGHVQKFRKLFWIMLIIAAPVIAFSEMFSMFLGYQLPDEILVVLISPILGTVMFFWGGWPFLDGARYEIRARKPGMMLLISLAISVAYFASLGSSLGLLDEALDFWWELALLIVIMLLGHWVEMRSLAQTTSALDSLAALLPDEAEIVRGEEVHKISPSDLEVGDIVVVRPGARVPADGLIISGAASMDESMITGESQTIMKSSGESVVAGTIATDSAIRVEITAVGDSTTLAGIQKMVADAQSSSSRAQLIADRAAAWLFWFALVAAMVTFTVWSLVGNIDDGVVRAITVLVIACPHALGLAIPLVVAISTERAARGGVLIKDRLALESMRAVDTILFDKTGTLTKGQPEVISVFVSPGQDKDHVLSLAAAAEQDSEHPLAKAIVHAADESSTSALVATDFKSAPAEGVSAVVDGALVQVGGPHMLTSIKQSELSIADQWRLEGSIILHVAIDGQVVAAIQLADAIREESSQAVLDLHEIGRQVVMITGDAEAVASTVAKELGIDRYFAGVRPEDKAAKVKELQSEGRIVAMVGDGVNDAPALAQADVGIAIGAGTDVAIASAGVILASSDPRSVLSVITLSKKSYQKMKQNLWWAAGYNLISVPLAAGVLAPVGFILPMSVGAILMSLSTLLVALNAQLLRRLDISPSST
jgi:Cu2+-exporting ATPase